MKNKGFSLVELIVVIAIMAILVGVAVPVYTSYIGKANEAKDAQLLGEINSAFMTVAIEKQITDFTFAGQDTPDIPVDDNGNIDLSTMKPESFRAGMLEILGGDLKFNVIKDIWYNKDTHQFEDNAVVEYEYAGGVVRLSAEDIVKLKNSGFFTATGLGVNKLLDKVNYVSGFAAGVDSDVYAGILGTTEYMTSFLESIGVNVTNMSEDDIAASFATKLRALAVQKIQDTCEHNIEPVEDCDECMNTAMSSLCANAAVLYAAQNSAQANQEIISVLTTAATQEGGCQKSLKDMLLVNTGSALSQVSAAYGLYVSYAYSLPEGDARDAAIAATDDPMGLVINGKLDETGFQEYLKTSQAQSDLDGYLAAMNMMTDSTNSNADAVTNLLLNGFSDEDLKAVFGEAMGDN